MASQADPAAPAAVVVQEILTAHGQVCISLNLYQNLGIRYHSLSTSIRGNDSSTDARRHAYLTYCAPGHTFLLDDLIICMRAVHLASAQLQAGNLVGARNIIQSLTNLMDRAVTMIANVSQGLGLIRDTSVASSSTRSVDDSAVRVQLARVWIERLPETEMLVLAGWPLDHAVEYFLARFPVIRQGR